MHSYGGQVFADVIGITLAKKAVAAGADGLACVSAGAGGHTGFLSPFAFVSAVREFFDGYVITGGGISDRPRNDGEHVDVYREAHCVIVMFDVTTRKSWEHAKTLAGAVPPLAKRTRFDVAAFAAEHGLTPVGVNFFCVHNEERRSGGKKGKRK